MPSGTRKTTKYYLFIFVYTGSYVGQSRVIHFWKSLDSSNPSVAKTNAPRHEINTRIRVYSSQVSARKPRRIVKEMLLSMGRRLARNLYYFMLTFVFCTILCRPRYA